MVVVLVLGALGAQSVSSGLLVLVCLAVLAVALLSLEKPLEPLAPSDGRGGRAARCPPPAVVVLATSLGHFSIAYTPTIVWELIFMMVILKIPIAYLCFVVYWAVKAEPNPPEPVQHQLAGRTGPSRRRPGRRTAAGPGRGAGPSAARSAQVARR